MAEHTELSRGGIKGLQTIVYKKVAQVVSELVGRCGSSVECLVWSRAIDQCAKCVVNVKNDFPLFSPMFTCPFTSAPPDLA